MGKMTVPTAASVTQSHGAASGAKARPNSAAEKKTADMMTTGKTLAKRPASHGPTSVTGMPSALKMASIFAPYCAVWPALVKICGMNVIIV